MNLVFTCGGTGGHIYPAIAVANLFHERQPDCKILFVGAEDGIERDLVPREGFALETIKISNLQRKLTPAGIAHNAIMVKDIAGSLRKARRVLREFEADVVIGTGGYASFPALREGARLGIPTLVHESNAVPGLATRMVAATVDRIMVSFEACRKNYKQPEKVIVTGTPAREEFLYRDKNDARKQLGLDDRPLIVSYWGSLGAREMNKKIAQFIALEAKDEKFQHIHATGSYGWRWMPDYVKELGLDLSAHPAIDMREYIYDMPTVMAAADLMICRAGAGTISELTISGTPSIIVPSPNVTDDHQAKNADVLAQAGAAVVLRERDTDGETLYRTACEVLSDPDRLQAMRKALSDLAVVDSTQRIYDTVMEVVKAP
ncbi:MAG: undecaprenyldiphospho-muramoylpentapeptide beta-N-acetylglucosaminyltransferase [Oscillospiraceae bacterium]|nr:undecaprenyldiphospho-muramoylpentapeptide beta-N-acetylglucosaminyltransferase [Oscillospiraceae bacterium]